jgi:hypothetical protein
VIRGESIQSSNERRQQPIRNCETQKTTIGI